MKHGHPRLILAFGVLTLAASTASAQHPRTFSKKEGIASEPVRPITAPQATISGPANGLYCPDMSEKAVGMHDLGWIPAGRPVTVAIQAVAPATFDPVATVFVTSLGGGSAQTTNFYDNDSGGAKDPQISFTSPSDGSYFLLVGDNANSGGCYRFQVNVR